MGSCWRVVILLAYYRMMKSALLLVTLQILGGALVSAKFYLAKTKGENGAHFRPSRKTMREDVPPYGHDESAFPDGEVEFHDPITEPTRYNEYPDGEVEFHEPLIEQGSDYADDEEANVEALKALGFQSVPDYLLEGIDSYTEKELHERIELLAGEEGDSKFLQLLKKANKKQLKEVLEKGKEIFAEVQANIEKEQDDDDKPE